MHQHCMKCYKKLCVDLNTENCGMISCANCGMWMHACKMDDHLNICSRLVIPCINSLNGCPCTMRKCEIGNHLNVCPASTVVCTMEWNRRPLQLENTIQTSNYNPNEAIFSHFDKAFALRDQRVLLEASIPNNVLEKIVADSEALSMFSFSYESQSYESSLSENGANRNLKTIENEKQKKLGLTLSCDATDKSGSLHNGIGLNDTSNKAIPVLVSEKGDGKHNEVELPFVRKPLLRTKFKIASKRETANASSDTSDLEINTRNVKWMNPGVHVQGDNPIKCLFEIIGAYEKPDPISHPQHGEGLRCTLNDARLCSYRHVATQTRPFFDKNGHFGEVGKALQESFDEDCMESFIQSAHHDPNLYKTLALNQVVECLPRYEKKSQSTYSYMCNSFLRRDQFQAHFQNVHCEVYSNLNGWLEEKCPYSLYGCDFSRLRFSPDACNTSLIYDNSRSCLSIRPTTTLIDEDNSYCDKLNLLDLPWEILDYIFSYLDSYSIGQAAQTCMHLKNLAVSRLKDRGIVSLNWEKFKRIDGSVSWQVTGETWIFSNSFSTINKWVFTSVPSMCAHVNACSFASAAVSEYTEKMPVKLHFCQK